jgi:hypothetical protein
MRSNNFEAELTSASSNFLARRLGEEEGNGLWKKYARWFLWAFSVSLSSKEDSSHTVH